MLNAQSIFVVDAHTTGTPIRVVTGGIPPLKGASINEKMEDMRKNHDWLRTCIMHQPRGFLSLVAGVLVPPTNLEADYGLFFLDALTYQPMCGAGCFSIAKVLVETGMVQRVEPETKIVLETPTGLVTLFAKIKDDRVESISLQNVPAFLYRKDLEIDVAGIGKFLVDIGYGGNFFVLTDVKNLPYPLNKDNVDALRELSKEILLAANKVIKVEHPTNPAINYLDQVLYIDNEKQDDDTYAALCVFGDAQADISPCGTGTSTRLAQRFFRKQVALEEQFVQKSVYGGTFIAKGIKETTIGDMPAVIPYLSCRDVHITGFNHLIVEANDKLKAGFISW
jgi:proline racemase